MRLRTTLTALAEVGDVDLFATVAAGDASASGGPDIVGVESCFVERTTVTSRLEVLRRWATGREPRLLLHLRADESRERLAAWARPPYDLVWYFPGTTYALLNGVVPGRTVVDLDNLLDRIARGERAARAADRRAGRVDHLVSRAAPRARSRTAVTTMLDRIDEGRWATWQRRVAAAVDAVIVCSETDRARLGVDNAVVIPNGYEPPDPLPARPAGRTARRFAMVARCTYGPNLDAAWWFADEVFPRIRTALPDAEFRVVGAHDFRLDALARRAGVTLTGEVPDPAPELAAADVVVTPVRFGSGTRIKVIEAFAHRIPVASTTLGCEGLGVVDGVHALVADDPSALASACTRLVEDPTLADRLTTSAHALFCDRYQTRDVQRAVVAVARDIGALPRGVANTTR
jgi:glycosyltransferase involved in cell wall biosynthesis